MAFCDTDKSVRICSEVEITYVQFKSMDIYRRCISSRASILKMQALLFFLPCGLFENFPFAFSPQSCAHWLLLIPQDSVLTLPSATLQNLIKYICLRVMQNTYCIALHCIPFYWRKIFCFTCYYSTSSQQNHCFSYVLNTYLFKE